MERDGGGVGASPDRACPEHLPDHGGVLQQALLRVWQPVEASGDDALKRLRERKLVGRSLFRVELDELLRVQRVTARSLEQGLLRLGCEQGPGEQAPDQLRRLLVGQR